MTIQELIDQLEEFPNKSLEVYFAQKGRVLSTAYLATDFDKYSEICFYAIIE